MDRHNSDAEFLQFIYDRLKNVYGENELYDYMHRLKDIINSVKKIEKAQEKARNKKD